MNIVARKPKMVLTQSMRNSGLEIYVAIKGEADQVNTAEIHVIDRAKQAQVPKHVIDKEAIDKARKYRRNLYKKDVMKDLGQMVSC